MSEQEKIQLFEDQKIRTAWDEDSVAILSLSFFDYTSANSLPQELQKQLF